MEKKVRGPVKKGKKIKNQKRGGCGATARRTQE